MNKDYIMDSIEHLATFVQALAMDDMETAKAAHAAYTEQKAIEMMNEDHDVLLTDVGIKDFLKTLHTRAKKADKEEEFFTELSKFTSTKVKSPEDFDKTVGHFSKNKKSADKFIHQVEANLRLLKDDPAKDIKGEKD